MHHYSTKLDLRFAEKCRRQNRSVSGSTKAWQPASRSKSSVNSGARMRLPELARPACHAASSVGYQATSTKISLPRCLFGSWLRCWVCQFRASAGFKAATGITPHQWILNARLRRAEEMLSDGDLPLSEIAISTGFSEQSNFNRAFRRAVGIAPGGWRRQFQR
jgi:hypothetical protein